jgi:hypothetical protein
MNKPKLTQAEAQILLNPFNLTDIVQVLGIRGYYKQTMGNPVKNDRGIYDDALFILSPDIFAAYNANTDPSVYRPGIATLTLGVWRYKPGKHKINSPQGYPAFVQNAKVTVHRDGEPEDTGWFGINIHRGGYNTTSSLGCQTIYPTQWESFRSTVNDQLKRYNQRDFPYILIEN